TVGATKIPFELIVVASKTSDVTTEETKALMVDFARSGDDAPAPQHRRIRVSHGHYAVEFGASFPMIYRGSRTVDSLTHANEKTEVPHAALSGIVFFRGRPKGEVFFHGAEAWGLQIGTDIDLTKDLRERDYYLGAAWEPVAGVGFGAGLAFVRGQFLV